MNKLFLFVLSLAFLTSCHGQGFPHTEKECIKEASFIIDKIKLSQYDSVLFVIKKYSDFSNYTVAEVNKEYNELATFISQNKNANCFFKYGAERLTESNVKGIITDRFAIYYFIKDSTEKKLCDFKYSHAASLYQLTFMGHNLHKKKKAGLK